MKKEPKVILFKRQYDGVVVKLESPGSDQDLAEMFTLFREFLLGCGYGITGDIIETEESDETLS